MLREKEEGGGRLSDRMYCSIHLLPSDPLMCYRGMTCVLCEVDTFCGESIKLQWGFVDLHARHDQTWLI